MNKQEFLNELKSKLNGIPKREIDDRISFYSEMLDDQVEEGLSEEEAVSRLGSIQDIVKQITADIPLSKLVKEKITVNRKLTATEIALLALGSPIWLSLLIVVFAVFISIYVVAWSLIISLWAIEFSLSACSLGGAIAFFVFIAKGNAISAFAILGAGTVCIGLAILGFFACKYLTKTIVKLTKQIFIWIKLLFIKKEKNYEQ